MNADLDNRARDAAAAAKASVAHLVHTEPRPVSRRARPVALLLGGLALTIAAVLNLRTGDDNVTKVATGPAQQDTMVGPGPPGTSSFGPGVGPDGGLIGIPLSSGFAGDRFRWALYAEGPSRNLCLAVQSTAESEPDPAATTCSPAPSDGSAKDANRPVVLTDGRVPSFVFGRIPADVAELTVVLSDGTALARQAPVQTPIGQFYAVELPDRSIPRAVIGHRKDGTSVRYEY